MDFNSTELIGYVASALVVVSLAMTSVVRLRAISLVGSVAFVVYGVLIESVPIMVTNVAIAALNVWFLRARTGRQAQPRRTRGAGRRPVPRRLPELPPRRHPPLPARLPLDATDASLALLLMRDGFPAGRSSATRTTTNWWCSWTMSSSRTATRRSRAGCTAAAPPCSDGWVSSASPPAWHRRAQPVPRLAMASSRVGERYVLALPR